jgi:hypothetical protein
VTPELDHDYDYVHVYDLRACCERAWASSALDVVVEIRTGRARRRWKMLHRS